MKTKTLFKTFLMIVAFTIIMTSCKKDEAITIQKNFFEVKDEPAIILTQGYILDHGVHGVTGNPEIRHMHCDFMTGGLSYDQANEDFSGQGSRVSIAFFTNLDGQIPTGTYAFDHTDLNEAYSFNYGFIWENHNSETGEGDVHDFTDGTCIVVNDEDNNYDFTWDIELSTGKRFIGTYKGKMTYKDVE